MQDTVTRVDDETDPQQHRIHFAQAGRDHVSDPPVWRRSTGGAAAVRRECRASDGHARCLFARGFEAAQ